MRFREILEQYKVSYSSNDIWKYLSLYRDGVRIDGGYYPMLINKTKYLDEKVIATIDESKTILKVIFKGVKPFNQDDYVSSAKKISTECPAGSAVRTSTDAIVKSSNPRKSLRTTDMIGAKQEDISVEDVSSIVDGVLDNIFGEKGGLF